MTGKPSKTNHIERLIRCNRITNRSRRAAAALRQTSGPSARALTLAYLLALQFLYSWAWTSSDLLRPLFRRLYQLRLAEAGAAYSAQATGALIGGLMVGRVQHLVGRRAILAIIATGCGATLMMGGWVDNFATLLLQRLAMGLFMGGVFPVTVSLIVDLFPAGSRGKLASLIDGTYFVAVIALGWAAARWMGSEWQRLFWPAASLLILLGMGAFALPLPDHPADRAAQAPRARDLFAPALRRRTVAVTALIALNACAHQAFTGWLTIYLVEVARVSPRAVAATISAQYVGSIVGCVFWGAIVDHWGRRTGALGLVAAGLFAGLFILLPAPLPLRQAAVFGFGFGLSTVVTLGPWLAELFPPALRAPATSIFQWGRFVSLLAPPLSGIAAEHVGLPAVMVVAAMAFLASGMIWRAMPETHRNRSRVHPRAAASTLRA